MRAIVVGLLFALLAGGSAVTGQSASFEVWAVDQSNTTGTTGGGTLYVCPGPALEGVAAAAAEPERIDLGGAANDLCFAGTGSVPVRPHMLVLNAGHTHAVLAFVASGHVLFLDAASRTPLECIDVGAQAHAAFPSPDSRYVIVANQNGKLMQRISTNYGSNTFTLEPAATIDLANCTTPSGAPCQAAGIRPDNAPICPIIDSSSRFAFVTLRGGGLLVVDIRSTPMRIVAEYDRATIHPNGCGGVEVGGKMYADSGGGTGGNLTEFDVYAFRLADFSTAPSLPNTPAPTAVFSEDVEEADAHGMTLTKDGRYLWVADRGRNFIFVIDTQTDALVNRIDLIGEVGDDPAPDLLGISPAGNRVLATFRGSLPLTGDPHVATGSTPGVGVIRVEQGGRVGTPQAIARIANVDAAGVDRADPHALAVRRR